MHAYKQSLQEGPMYSLIRVPVVSTGFPVLACCLQALEAVHARGVGHGDIAHNNIILKGDKV